MAQSSPLIFDTSDGQQLRINMIGAWLRRHFGRKIIKLSLDGGFTCPNRDGTKGRGGCLFCSGSGSGDLASGSGDLDRDLQEQIALLSDKWPHAGYLAYFQSHTNTYAPPSELRDKFFPVLSHDKIAGLAIATRPDCLGREVCDLLEELHHSTFLWVELGLQSIHRQTMEAMNLCYSLEDYDRAVEELTSRGIRVVPHLIFGLPGETKEMMQESLRYICRDRIFGLKIHMLNVVNTSGFPDRFPDYQPFSSIDEYTDLIVSSMELIPPEITIHRMSGDAPRPTLIAPRWSWKKRTILNEIHRKMKERDTWQGRRL